MDTRRLLTIAALTAAALTTRATDYVVEPGAFTIYVGPDSTTMNAAKIAFKEGEK